MTLITPEEELASTKEFLASDIETIRTLLLRFGQVHPCFVVGTLAAPQRANMPRRWNRCLTIWIIVRVRSWFCYN